MKRILLSTIIVVLTFVLTGCQADVTTSIHFNGDGSGNFTVNTALDKELSDKVQALQTNPITKFTNRVQEMGEGWSVKSTELPNKTGTAVSFSKNFSNSSDLDKILSDLTQAIQMQGITVMPTIAVTTSDQTFGVSGSLPLIITDQFAQTNGFADAQDATNQMAGSVASTLLIRSDTPVVSPLQTRDVTTNTPVEGATDSTGKPTNATNTTGAANTPNATATTNATTTPNASNATNVAPLVPATILSLGEKQEGDAVITVGMGQNTQFDVTYQVASSNMLIWLVAAGVIVFVVALWARTISKRMQIVRGYKKERIAG